MRNTTVTELYLGDTLGWVDVSDDGRQGVADSGGGTTITRVADDPGTMDLVLANPGGRYSPRNPRSDYYGLLGRNTPVRFGVELLADAFGTAVAAGWGTGWTSFGAGGTVAATDSTVSGGTARHFVPLAAAYRVSYYNAREFRDAEVRVTVDMVIADVVGGGIEPANILFRLQDTSTYYMARVEVSASEVVTVSLHHSTGGTIAAAVTVTGLVFAGQPLEVAASCVGDRLAVKVWDPAAGGEPRDWQVTAVDTQLSAAGHIGVRSGVASGNSNTKPVEFRYDNLRVIDRRAHMEVSSWPPRWNTAGTDTWVPVQAAGIMRRLGQGNKPPDSALYRYLTVGRSGMQAPTAYWPLEDPAGSPSARSTVDGVAPMGTFGFSRFTAPVTGTPVQAAGLPVFASAEGIAGSSPVVDLSQGGVLQGAVPAGGGTGWRIEWVMRAPRDKSATVIPIRFETDGTWRTWDVQIESTGVFSPFYVGDALGGAVGSGSATFNVFDGQPHHYAVEGYIFGANAAADLRIDGQLAASYSPFVPPMAGSPGNITRVIINPLEVQQDEAESQSMPVIGHVAVWNPYPGDFPTTEVAMLGHAGELAAARVERLCAEQGVTVFVTDGPDDSAAMGPQRPARFLELLRECEDADGGILAEAREQLALTYRCLGALYNQTPLELDYTHLAPGLEPTDDDDQVRNDVTVTRPDGGWARSVLGTGPLSVQDPPDGVGVYDTSVPLNVASDAQLPDQAGWRRHVGTWDEARYPRARVDLAAPLWDAAPDLAAAVTALGGGDVVALAGLPEWLPPGPALSMVRGSVERVDEHARSIDWTWVPAGPYTLAEADGDPRVAADGSFTAGLTDVGMSMLLTSSAENGTWTEDPADFPLDMRVGGEKVTVSAIGRSFIDPFFRTVGAGGWDGSWTISNGTASGFSVNGSEGLVAVSAVNAEQHATYDVGTLTQDLRLWCTLPVTPTGAGINWGVLLRYADANNYLWADAQVGTDSSITVRLIKRLAGVATVYGTLVASTTHSTTAPRALRAEANDVTFRARLWSPSDVEPSGWDITATDTAFPTGRRAGAICRLMTGNTNTTPVTLRFDNAAVANPQLVTLSARGVNGVQRTWPSATDVDVWTPAIAPL